MRPRENYTPFAAVGLGLTLAILIVFQIYLLGEPGRIRAVEAADLAAAQAALSGAHPTNLLIRRPRHRVRRRSAFAAADRADRLLSAGGRCRSGAQSPLRRPAERDRRNGPGGNPFDAAGRPSLCPSAAVDSPLGSGPERQGGCRGRSPGGIDSQVPLAVPACLPHNHPT